MNDILNRKEYKFLKKVNNIVLLTFGGSIAYGTNIETSDIDLRGCSLNSKEEILLGKDFKQKVYNETDTIIYSFNKFIKLLTNVNPNIIEMLGCKPEHYLILTDIGKQLIDNKHMFLSKKVASSFGGYANQQLRRLENALSISNKNVHIKRSLDRKISNLSIKDYRIYEKDNQLFIDINLKKYSLYNFSVLASDISNVVNNYSKLNKTNNKKDDAHLNKHMMHLMRLYLMCFDILEKEEINTYRKNDIDFLMSIRKGKYLHDGKIDMEFFDIINEYEKRLLYDINNTSLPEQPNMNLINEFRMDINSKIIDWSK